MRAILVIFLSIFLTILLLATVFTSIGDPANDWGILSVFLMMGLAFGLFILFIYFIDQVPSNVNKAKKGIEKKINEKIEQNQLKNHIKDNQLKYNEAKNNFHYFSNDKLIELYEKFSGRELNEDVEQLALEEELVKRGLIDHSPMHEKLYLIKKKLFD